MTVAQAALVQVQVAGHHLHDLQLSTTEHLCCGGFLPAVTLTRSITGFRAGATLFRQHGGVASMNS